MKQLIKKIPLINQFSRYLYRLWLQQTKPFEGSEQYWQNRYQQGGNSGDGSYNKLALFKADVLNRFVAENSVLSVIEYGCGDGNQLSLAEYPVYRGFDVSPEAIKRCRERFAGDQTKTFNLVKHYNDERAELTLSLDVVYHLIEDEIFEEYMQRLFNSADRYVVIYSSDSDKESEAPHVRHRKFTRWIKVNKPVWKLEQHIPNAYPFTGDNQTGSFADFFIFSKG